MEIEDYANDYYDTLFQQKEDRELEEEEEELQKLIEYKLFI